MYGIIYTVHVPLCSIHFLISLIDKRSSFPMLYNPTFLYTFVFSISWLLKPAMYAYKYRLAFLSETNRWLSINYQTKKVCLVRHTLFLMLDGVLFHSSAAEPVFCIVIFLEAAHDDSLSGTGMNELAVFQVDAYMCHFLA